MILDENAIHQWTARNTRARYAYQQAPNLDWCAIDNCDQLERNGGYCWAHHALIVRGLQELHVRPA